MSDPKSKRDKFDATLADAAVSISLDPNLCGNARENHKRLEELSESIFGQVAMINKRDRLREKIALLELYITPPPSEAMHD